MLSLRNLLTDAAMDACVLITAQLCFGRLKPARIAAAFAVMQFSTCAYLLFGDMARNPLAVLGTGAAAAYILLPARKFRDAISAAACILVVSAAAAGLMTATGSRSIPLAAISAMALLLLLLRRRMNIRYRWNIEVMVENYGVSMRFDALIDTGNRLHEPISGLPVIIVAKKAVPPGFSGGKKMRLLSFGVLGSSGEIPAFRPDSMRIRQYGGEFLKPPECYVAVFPGEIPGGVRALAPPEFAESFEPFAPGLCNRFIRRNDHVVF